MAIKIIISDTLRYKVEGVFTDASGAQIAFDFHLIARRLPQDSLSDQLPPVADGKVSVPDFLADVVTGWSGVLDDTGAPVPFSHDALRSLWNGVPGSAGLAFAAYCDHVRVRAKN